MKRLLSRTTNVGFVILEQFLVVYIPIKVCLVDNPGFMEIMLYFDNLVKL